MCGGEIIAPQSSVTTAYNCASIHFRHATNKRQDARHDRRYVSESLPSGSKTVTVLRFRGVSRLVGDVQLSETVALISGI
jgi:hypothetical protein